MANTLLTPTAVTRKALFILHQKLNFIGTIVRDYDDSFAKKGAKIGDTLKIRLPNQYSVRTGAVMDVTETSESSVSLQVATQKGVDLNFTSDDLTLDIDDFSERILEPSMAVLAANIEADVMNVYKDVNNQINNQGSAATFAKVLAARKRLIDNLAPLSDRNCNLNTQDNVDLVDALKGLFNNQEALSKQYKEGYMGRTAGMDFMENTLWPTITPGARAGYVTNAVTAQTGSTLTVGTGTGSIALGEVFTIAGVNRVHPETKADTGQLMQFVVTTAYAGTTTTITFSPAIVASGAYQNVSNGAANAKAVTFGGTASTVHGLSMAYHKSAFCFATADLVMPNGVDFAAREQHDGISIRVVRQYDINNDKFPCRLDVLYGYKTLRAQLACRLANN